MAMEKISESSDISQIPAAKEVQQGLAIDPSLTKAEEFLSTTDIPETYQTTIMEELRSNPTSLKNFNDFKTAFEAKARSAGFNEAFTEFAIDQIAATGVFRPNELAEKWEGRLLEGDETLKQLQKTITGIQASLKTATVEEQESVFDLLDDLIELLISMTDTYFNLAMSFSTLLENETNKQKVYLDVLNSIKTVQLEDLPYLKDTDKAQTAVDTFNQVTVPGAQQRVNALNEISQQEGQKLSTLITGFSDDAKTASDIVSEIFSKYTSWGSVVYR